MGVSWKEYWTKRAERQGETYVAKGGGKDSYEKQLAEVSPLIDMLIPSDSETLLDFGCGPGRFRPVLEQYGEYVGVDLIDKYGTEPLGPFDPERFDVAIAIFVLQHIVEPGRYAFWVKELYLGLKPQGRLIVVDHYPMLAPADHMRPRGFELLRSLHPWGVSEHVASYDSHWVGVFIK